MKFKQWTSLWFRFLLAGIRKERKVSVNQNVSKAFQAFLGAHSAKNLLLPAEEDAYTVSVCCCQVFISRYPHLGNVPGSISAVWKVEVPSAGYLFFFHPCQAPECFQQPESFSVPPPQVSLLHFSYVCSTSV